MALDPTISLRANVPQAPDLSKYAGLAMLGLQQQQAQASIENTKANTANTLADNPRVVAAAQQAQFAAKKQQDIANIFKANTKVNADGSQTVNTTAIPAQLAGAGYGDDAIQYFKQSTLAAHDAVDTADAAQSFKDHTFKSAAATAAALDDYEPGAGVAFLNKAVNVDNPAFSDMRGSIGDDPRFHMVYTTPQQVKAMAQGTLTPADQVRQAMDIKNQQFQFASAAYNPDPKAPENDPNSTINTTAGRIAGDAGLPWPTGMTVFKAHQLPGYDQALGIEAASGIVPGATRISALGDAVSKGVVGKQLQNAVDAAATLPQDIATTPGALISGGWNKYLSANPKLAALTTAVQVHNNLNPNDPIDPAKLTPAQVVAKLNADLVNVQASQAGSAAIAGTTSVPGAPARSIPGGAPAGAPVAPVGAPAAPAPQGAMVKIKRLSDGKVGAVPAAQADQFIASGKYTRAQ
jgi:hypothetical protein